MVLSRIARILMVAFASVIALIVFVVAQPTNRADAAVGDPSIADTARLLGYMFGDGEETDGVWDVNGPSGASNLIEYLVELHGGEWVDRGKLRFTLAAPYDFAHWKTGLPDDDARTMEAVRNHHFLAALLEAEGGIDGLVYDQSACCVPGYTIGRLTELRDLLREVGFETAALVRYNNVDSGKITIGASEFAELRAARRFVCPVRDSDVRIPGGTDYGRYGDLRWFGDGTRWSSHVRTDCTQGQATPAPQAPVGTCSVSADGNQVTVTWSFSIGDVVVRRNGGYVTDVPARQVQYTESRPDGTHTYDLRVYAFGERGDANCGSVTVGGDGGGGNDGPCTVREVAGGIQLTWDDFGRSSYSVRRNGSWVASVTGTSYTTNIGSVDDAWTIRYRQDGQRIDVACGGDGGGEGPCSVSAAAGGVRLDWDAVAGVSTYQVRVDGGWKASVTGTSWTGSGDTNGNWTVRYRLNGSTVDLACD